MDSVGEGEGGMMWENGIETCILSCKKQIASLGSIQDAWGWCIGMTQRDDMERVVGGGFRIGNSCTPVVDSCQCMAKPIQYGKVKLKKKKRERERKGLMKSRNTREEKDLQYQPPTQKKKKNKSSVAYIIGFTTFVEIFRIYPS